MPDSPNYLWIRTNTLLQMDETPDVELGTAANAFLTCYDHSTNIVFLPSPRRQIAKAYIKRGIRLDEVPSLVERGATDSTKLEGLPSDREDYTVAKMRSDSKQYSELDSAAILADLALATKNQEVARDAMAKAKALKPDKPWLRTAQLHAQAKWTEAQGRKLDALLYYRAMADQRPTASKAANKDDLAETIARLQKEVGGTDATKALWPKAPGTLQVAENSVWAKPDKEMKPWQLSDLQGKTWKPEQLRGKTALVNVWATWCGRCRGEHPHLQKLMSN